MGAKDLCGLGYTITFGKHTGKTLAEILDDEYQYIIWLSKDNVLSIDEKVLSIALDLQENYEEDLNHNDCSWGDYHDIF